MPEEMRQTLHLPTLILLSLTITAPLLGMMGFSLMVSTTLILLSSPLLLLFSPILLPTALLLATVVAALGFAAATGLGGVFIFSRLLRGVTPALIGYGGIGKYGNGYGGFVKDSELDTLTESGQRVREEKGVDGDGNEKKVVVVKPPES